MKIGAKHKAGRRPGSGALIALAGAAALTMISSASSLALTAPDGKAKIVYGTPKDLPITLSGSYLAGRLAGIEKDFGHAAAFFEEALANDPTNIILLQRTFLLKLTDGDMAAAQRYAQELYDTGERDFLGQLTLAAAAIQNGDTDTAISYLEDNAGGPLAELAIQITKGWALYGAGKTDDALAAISELQGPEWFEIFKSTHRALILFAAGRNDEALTEIEAAYKADQGAIRIVDTYARILAANGKQEEALKVLSDYDRLLRGHPFLKRTREEIEAGQVKVPEIKTAASGVSEILYGLGAAIARDGAEEVATSLLRLALDLHPKAQFAAISLGTLMERMKKPEEAIKAFKMVPEGAALKRDAEIQIGLDYDTLGDIDAAKAHMSAIIEKDPEDIEAIVSLGNILRAHKVFDEAEEIYTKGLDVLGDKISKPHWLLFYFRGICRERQDKWTLAEADFRKALELFKDQPLVLNYLGYSLVDQGLKLDEALGMIQKAVELRPTDGYIIDSLGWVYYRLGRYEDAVKELERAINQQPADPVINDHLGDAYWKVGRRNEARFQWNHARDLGADEKEMPKILDKIKNGLSNDATDEAKVEPQKNGG